MTYLYDRVIGKRKDRFILMKRQLSLFLAMILLWGLTACSTSSDQSSTSTPASGSTSAPAASSDASIYYLNFKPEVAEVYAEIAAAYKAETGVTVNVVTAASGGYEQQLKAEIAKADAPTIFQINGPRGYAAWKDYCADLRDSALYEALTDKSLAVTTSDGGVYGIPNVIEGYGIIVNNAVMERYFALADRNTDVKSLDDIRSFATLRTVAEDMTAHKEALGIRGVFASTSLSPGEDWRWHTHLANVPVSYEFKDNGTDLTGDAVGEITFKYSDNFRQLFDLYLNNSVTAPKLLGSKQVADSMAEFALGQCAMVQNGNWAWNQIAQIEGNTVRAEDVKFLPLYIGVEGEETQGLCIGTENFLAINRMATPEKQKMSLDFLYWLYTSETGKRFVTEKLQFIAPFESFTADERPDDPLAREVVRWMERDDVTTIPWNFTVFPSVAFKEDFGAALLGYAQGAKDWTDVVDTVKTRWKEELPGS